MLIQPIIYKWNETFVKKWSTNMSDISAEVMHVVCIRAALLIRFL